MAVTPESLTLPTGELSPELFPEYPGTLFGDTLLAWITAGMAATAAITDAVTRDVAVTAFVYARAYGALYQRMATAPASVTFGDGQGGHAYSGKQLDAVAALVDRWTDVYNRALIAAAAPTAPVAEPPRPSWITTGIAF